MNEFRQDPVTGSWVIISAERDHRPNQFQRTDDDAEAVELEDGAASCPFCAKQMDTPPIVEQYGASDSADPWQVCVVTNRYPSLDPIESGYRYKPAEDLLEGCPAAGRHEVVIESPTHQVRTGDLSPSQFLYMLQAYRDRIRAMRTMPGIHFALAMKNSGRDAGASLQHAHSQIFGLPMVPEQVQRELHRTKLFFDRNERCLFCDLIVAEILCDDRIVALTDDFIAWCPHASRFSYEIWLAPRKHCARFEDSDHQTLQKLGRLLQAVIRKVDQSSRIGAFNYFIHSQPFAISRQDHYHWHIEILPRIAKQAGFEWATGVHINTVEPAQAARELRLGS